MEVNTGCCGYRAGLVFKAHRLLYHSACKARGTFDLGPVTRVKKKTKKKKKVNTGEPDGRVHVLPKVTLVGYRGGKQTF